MSVKYWLFSCCINDQELKLIQERYLEACRNSVIPDNLRIWFDSEDESVLEVSDGNHSALHEFTWSFNIESLMNLTQIVLTNNFFEVDESNIVDFIMMDDMPPVALIAYGLGPSKFQNLPGTMGVSLMSKLQLLDYPFARIFSSKEKINSRTRIDLFLKSAYSFCDSPPSREVIDKIVSFYTRAESEAILRGCNLLTLSSRSL